MRNLGRSAAVVLLCLWVAAMAYGAGEPVTLAVGERVQLPFAASVKRITGADRAVVRYYLNASDRIEVEGLTPGRSPLEVRLGDGTVRIFEIDVAPAGRSVAAAPPSPVSPPEPTPEASFDVALVAPEPAPAPPPAPSRSAEVVVVPPVPAPAPSPREVVPAEEIEPEAVAVPEPVVVPEPEPVAVPEPPPEPVFELEMLAAEPPPEPAPVAVAESAPPVDVVEMEAPAPAPEVTAVEIVPPPAPRAVAPPAPPTPRFDGTIVLARGEEQSFSLSEQGARIETSEPGVVSIERDPDGVVTLVARRPGVTELTLTGGSGAATRYAIEVIAPATAPAPPPAAVAQVREPVVVRAEPPPPPPRMPEPVAAPARAPETVPVREQEVALLSFDLERDRPDYVTGSDLEKLEQSLRSEIRSAVVQQQEVARQQAAAQQAAARAAPPPAPAPVVAGPSPAEIKQAMKEALLESARAMPPAPAPAPAPRFEIRTEASAAPVAPPPAPPQPRAAPEPMPMLADDPIVSLEDFSGGVLRLGAGRSRVLTLVGNATRVAVADPEVGDVMLASPRQLMVTGKSPGVTSLIVWDSREEPVYVTLQVTDKRVAEKQVLLKVKIAELKRRRMRDLGIDFAVLLDDDVVKGGLDIVSRSAGIAPAQIPGGGGDLLGSSGALPESANLVVAQPDRNIFGFIRALEEQGLARILAEPNLVAINGQEASFLAGGEFPVPIVTSVSGGELPTVDVEFKEFGVRLTFEPTILADETITLRVAPEVSTLDFSNGVLISDLRIPALDTRRAETTVQMADGQSIVIAGLIMTRKQEVESKTPWLGDAPFVGAFFRSDDIQVEETELVILITANIVRPLPADAVPSLPFDRVKREIISRPGAH